MPVSYIHADMMEHSMQTITNTVNCVGVMGKGLALQFKHRFPEYNTDYVQKCKNNEVKVGKPYIFDLGIMPPNDKLILSFPTKYHWKNPSNLSWIENGLDYLVDNYKRWGIKSLGMPKLGCGLGGLEWNMVKEIMFKKLNPIDIIVTIYV